MAWKEPQKVSVVVTAWYLKHSTDGTSLNSSDRGATQTAAEQMHSAGDKCTWTATNECVFKVTYSQTKNGSYQDATKVNLASAGAVPMTVWQMPYSKPLYIRVDATPTRKITILSTKGRNQFGPQTGELLLSEMAATGSPMVGYWE